MSIFNCETKELKFDVEQLQKMQTTLREMATDLKDYKVELENALEQLKCDWNTPAGKKYLAQIDTDWGKQVEQYVTVIEAVESLLEEAVKQYAFVEEAVEKVKFYQ